MANPQIDPRVLQALAAGQDIGQFGYMPQSYQPGYWEGGDAGQWVNSGPAQTHLIQRLNGSQANVFDSNGNFLGMNSGDSDNMALAKFVMSALAMYGAGQGLSSLGGGAGGAEGLSGMDLAADGGANAIGGGGGSALGGAGAAGADMGGTEVLSGGAGDSALGTSGVSPFRAGEIASYSTNGSMASPAVQATGPGLLDQLGTWAKDNPGLVKLAGSALGAASSGDQNQSTTTNREPWGPAQPFLRGLLDQASTLSQQYQQNPFSPTQKQAYNNSFGLLNAANQMAPGLMSAMQANASGANAYSRANPTRPLTGSTAQFNFAPGLLMPFGS